MSKYWEGDGITLYLGDCRTVTEWLAADVLVCDPPYGIGWSKGVWGTSDIRPGIENDTDTSARDSVLARWAPRPALVFGSLKAAYPPEWKRMLVFRKPVVGSGIYGNRMPWLTNWEPIFVVGEWPQQVPRVDAIVSTRAYAAAGYSGYITKSGHPHAKPTDVMEQLISACPPGTIADPFAGSGSTLVAAKLQGRKAIGVELVEKYAEIAARRLDQHVMEFPL